MNWLRSVVAIGAGFVVTTLVYVMIGISWGGLIMLGVEVDADFNPTAAGMVRYAINVGAWILALSALGGFVAALLAPRRRWWHGLGVGVAISAAIVLLWLDGVRHGSEPAVTGSEVMIMVGIMIGCALGGLVGQGLVALLTRGHTRYGRSAEVPSD